MSIGSLGIKTHAVGLAPSIEAIARSVNRRGIVVRVRASDFTQPLGKMSASASEFTKSLEASNARVIAFGASAVIIGSVTTSFAQLVIQAVKVEKILADINAVLATSNENLAKFGDGLFNVARNTSQALEVAAEAALEFSRQGLSMEETLKRTNDALILTRLTGLAAADSVKGLTAAVNGFADAGLNTTEIINKLAAVDVKFAVSADDLINALARAGAVAQDAGVSFDQLIGAVTSAQQITARGGAVIGNSFKTIFTRLQRSSTLDRLQELGIAVKDLQGNTLPALTVLRELSRSYDTLGAATKAAVAEQVGGVFQINILKAALKDLGRENSLYAQATITSSEATNEAYQKNAMLQETLSSIATQTLTTVRELTANLGDLTLAPALKDFLDNFNSVIKTVSDLFGAEKGESIGADFAKGLARAVGSVLTGPGFFGLVLVFGKLFSSALKFAKNSVKDLLQIKTIKDQELGIQESIVNAMLRNVELSEQLVKLDGNQVKQEELVLAVLRQQTKEIEQQRQIAQNIAPALRKAGVQPNLIVTGNKSQKTQNSASGFIPNYSKQPTPIEEMKEKAGAKEGGYVAGKVSTMSIPKMGRVVYNDNETVKRFKGMDQPAIMPPKSSKAGKQYEKEFAGKHGFDPYASYGLIPNFALEATKVPGTNILNLPKAKMITETTQSNFQGEATKGWKTLEARLDHIVKSAMSYRDEFEALKKLGVDVLRRKMYFSSQKSSIKQNEMRAISRDQKKLSKSKGFASKNQHKITGNRFEGALFKGSLKQKGYYPSWTGAYTAKGRQKGEGDENFKVDFFAPGRKPIESKYGKYTPPNLIAKSIRLYSDQYIEKFLSKHGSSGLAENMGNKKLQDSAQMLTSLGYKDVGPKEVLRAGLSGGLIPNFAFKNTPIRLDGGFGRRGRNISDTQSGSFMNYTTNAGNREIDFLQSYRKGDAYRMFQREGQGKFMKQGGAYTSPTLKQQKSFKQGSSTNFEDLIYAFPQLQYRMQPNMVTSGKMIHGPAGQRFSFKNLKELRSITNGLNREQFRDALGAFPGTPGLNTISIQDLTTINTGKGKGDNIYKKYAEGLIPNFASRIYDRDRIQPGMATEILEQILSSPIEKRKHLLLGPAGSGKTTMAAQKYGSFIKDLKDAQTAESYTILSGAGMTKKGGVSSRLQKIINAVNKSKGGMVSYLRVSDKTIDERRDKRLSQPAKGDLRSLNALKGTKKAPKNQPDFVEAVKSLSTNFRVIKAFDGYIPNFESQNWQNEKSSGTIDDQLKQVKDRAEALEDKKGSKNHSHYNRGFIPNFMLGNEAPDQSTLYPTAGESVRSTQEEKVATYNKALKDFLKHQKSIKNKAWSMADISDYIDFNKQNYRKISTHYKTTWANLSEKSSNEIHQKINQQNLQKLYKGFSNAESAQAKGKEYEAKIQEYFGVQSLGHNAPIDYKNLGQKVSNFRGAKGPDGKVIKNPKFTLLSTTTDQSPVEAAAGTGHVKQHMGQKGPRFAAQNHTGYQNLKNIIKTSIQSKSSNKTLLQTGKHKIVELAQGGQRDQINKTGYDKNLQAFKVISTPEVPSNDRKQRINNSIRSKQANNSARTKRRVDRGGFNIDLFNGYGKSAHLVGSQKIELLEEQIEKEINKSYQNESKSKGKKFNAKKFISQLRKSGQTTFSIEYDKDILDLNNYPIKPKSHGHIPNFASAQLALTGGLVGKNKFGNIDRRQMTRLVRSNPYFNDLMNEHLTWDSFPKKDKRKLSRWLLKQGVSNRALQAYGLASMHSKSISEGISNIAMAGGYVPNFANPLGDAISREKEALRERGSAADIYIDQDNRLKNPKNPAGLLVANTRDEPKSGSQGVNRAISMGMNPKTHGASGGVIPNFQKGGRSNSTNQVTKQMKETGDASNDLMMKMMGLTTITYALQGAMGEAEEEASNFRKGMGLLNAAIMGLSQAAMVSMIVPKGKFGEGKKLYQTARDHQSTKSQNSGSAAKFGAKAGKASMMAKGAGGMLMGMLGPIGIAAAILIPVITALTENFDMFKGATELATRDLENLQKGLSKLENASSAAASLRDTSSRIIELEQKSGSRSISQQKEYYQLKHEEMKQQNKLNTAVNQAIASYSLKDGSNKESVEVQTLLNGSYEEQIEVLQRMQLAQQKLINMASNRKNLAEDLEKAGAQDFSMFSVGGTDELKNYKGILETGAIDLLSSFGTNYKNLSQEDLTATISELKNLRNDLDRGEGYQTDDFDKNSLKIISQGLTKGQDLNSLEISRLTNNLADSLAGVGKGVDRTFAGDQDRIPQAVRMFIDTMITGVQEAGNSAQKGESTKKENDLVFSKNLRSRDSNFLDEQNFLLKRDIELMKTRVDLEEKSLDLQRQENDLYNKELPSMFGLLTKDEEIDRKYDSELKAVDDKLATNISRNNIDANASIDKALEDLMQPEDFAQALFDKQRGFQEGNLTLLQALLSATLSSQEKEKFEEKKSAKIKDLTKQYEDTSKAISQPGYASDLQFNAMLSGASPGAKKLGLKTFKQAKQESYNKAKSNSPSYINTLGYAPVAHSSNMDSDATILKNLVKENAAKLRELMVNQGGMSSVVFDSRTREAKSSFNKVATSDKNVEATLGALKGQDMSPDVQKLIALKQSITEERGKEFYSKDNILNNSINAGLNVQSQQSEPSSLDGSSGQKKSIVINIDALKFKLKKLQENSNELTEEVTSKDKDLKNIDTIETTTEGQTAKPKTPDYNNPPLITPTTQPTTQPIAQPTSAQASINTDTFQFDALEKLSGTSKDDLNTPDITNQVNDLVGSFGALISDLLKNQEGVANKDGQLEKSLSPEAFSAALKKVVGSIKTPEVKLALIDQLESSGVISNMTKETQKVITEIRKTLTNTKDNNSKEVEKSKQDKRIINLKKLQEKIQKRTNQGFDEAQKFISGYKDINGDLFKAAQDDLSGRLKWAGLDESLAQIQLSNAKTLRDTGQIYETARAESEKSLTTKLTNNITEIETLRAQNDSLDATEKGLALAEDSFKKKSEENRSTQIELNNKLKLSNLSELLFNQATQESDIKTKQLAIENKLLAQKTKLYETTDALAKEVQAELENQRKKDYNAGLRSDGAFKDKSGIIKNKEDPFYGMTGFEADATIRQGTIARSQRDQLAAARSDYELYTGRGNDLRASDARLQMLQIQKQQNIEQGNGSLFSDTIAVRIAETNAEMERFGETLGNITFDTVQQGLKDVVTAMGDSTKSMKDVFLGFAGHIANAIGDALLDRATKQVTSGLMGLLGFDDISQNYNGGLIKGYASGGSTGSKAPAMLTAGEYVVRKKVVDRLGTSSLDKMNKTGNIDDSLSELYSKPNDESFDMSTQGAANIPPVMRFNEGGRLNAAISSITSPIAKFFSGGGFSNPFAPADESSNMMKFARGAGYVGGSSLAQYENREPVETSSPTAPVNPGETMLNTSSALSIDPTGRMMSARYRSTDSYSQQYGDYLLAKYQADVDAQNQKVMNKANEAQGILGKFTGAMIGHGVQQGITALSALKDVTGGFSDWSTSTQELNVQQQMAQKGINNASDLQSKSSALFNASHGGGNIGRENKLSKSQYAASLDMNRYAGETDFSQLNNFELSRMKDRGSQGFFDTHNRDRNFNVQRPMESASEASMQRELDVLGKEVGVLRKQTHPSASGNIRYTSSKNYGVSPRAFTPDNSIIGQDARGTHLQSLKTKQMSRGGKVFGPSGRDQVGPIMLDKGEYVIRASSVNNIEKKYPGFFDKLNSMKMNAGGPVDPNAQIKTEDQASGGGGGVTVNINVSSGGQASAEGGDSSDQAFASKIKDAVTQVISQEKRVGGMLSGK